MKIAEALRDAAVSLAGISDTARLDAELLMAGALNATRSEMLLKAHERTPAEPFGGFVKRRSGGEPVAYILGRQDFYGRSFTVDKTVLIPRADSETIIEAALPFSTGSSRLLDLGTGSGPLLFTLLAENAEATGVGVDAFADALAVAKTNASQLGVADRAQLLERDWHQPAWSADLGRFDCIVANPPYVEDAATLDPQVRDYEPHRALFAGEDGLRDYRTIIPHLRNLLNADGVAILEIGHTQADAVTALGRQSGFTARLVRDLADRPRGLVLR